ncbi:Disease resistance protein RGA2, putative [Ricinus communis]|uniref:Disease resistance protein RGA2, putative n=1 Tax=Ricinus communis TaxID=3988 RepID=B9SU66_RICCO|nr:Disease resistance protein RGA2, putative [Ricinus communis]|eukprot:XP_002529535.1 putative disease resistance RPP13-like protein 1 [Ricinus communis]
MEIALAVGGALLSPAFQVLLDKLTSMDLLNYARQGHVLDELKKWDRLLNKIYAFLDDAEEKQMTNQSVKVWVSELRHLAYDVEDILDEFDTEARRRRLLAEATPSTSNLRKFIPACCVGMIPRTVKFNAEVISMMEKITIRLEDIIREKDVLHLEEGTRGRISRVRERSATTCLVNEAQVYGREEDKEAVLRLLKGKTRSSEISVIPIVGMGGIGKTTLAQLVFNDTTLEFDFKAWVSVGEDFNVSKITKIILQSKDCDSEDLNSLQVRLKEKLSRNKFLIVLDDVWTENYDDWTLFRGPFEAGAPGSRIIITTRSEGVSSKMGTTPAYYLQKLSFDDCLSIFVYHALGTRKFDEYWDLEEIGAEIAKKCQGLPLAAKTLGGLLRGKPNLNAWIEVLESKIWDLPEDNGILPALRLSYHHLPSHLKRCFAHCAIFPKDYKFHWHDLVLLWMAEGLLQQSKTKKKMEDIGLDYFNQLLSRSLFEECSGGFFGMHNLITDLAHSVAGETFIDLVDDLGGSQLYADFDKVRNLTYTKWLEISQRLEVLCKLKRLRTLIVLDLYREKIDVELNILLPELKCLRVLSLEHASITQLPNSIGRLNHLRFLNLAYAGIKWLPESVCALLNLHMLVLNWCFNLTTLPQGIKYLINLHFLEITETARLQEMPVGVGNLTCLQVLTKFIVGKGDGLRLRELKDLLYLQGELSLQGLHNVVDIEDAKVANLKDKHGLNTLEMRWRDDFNDSRSEREETLVLDSLQPPTHLEILTIAFFGGTSFPIWLGEHSFVKLVQVDLISCMKSMSLPSLGRLPSLRRLSIKNAESVRTVGVEFYGDDLRSWKPFQSLESLQFQNMTDWEHWTCSAINFPRLHHLELRNCPKLMGELPKHLPSLENLHIVACPQLKDSLTSLPSLSTLEIENCSQVVLGKVFNIQHITSLQLCGISGLACLEKRLMWEVKALKVLKVEDCSDLSVLWKDGCRTQELSCLKRVLITKCLNLKVLASGDQGFPCNLEFLILDECKNLEKLTNELYNLASFAHLRIGNCPKLKFPATGLPQTLTYLKFEDSHKQGYLMYGDELNDPGHIYWYSSGISTYEPSQEEGKMLIYISDLLQLESLLQSLVCSNIKHISIPVCQNVKCFTDFKHSLLHLTGLTITSCCRKEMPTAMSEWGLSSLSSLQRLEINRVEMVSFPDDDGRLLPTSLKHLLISEVDNLQSISKGILNLTSLKILNIHSCKSISSLPKEGLPVSLQTLDISYCPSLEHYLEEKGNYWSIISQIPERRMLFGENPFVCVIQ